MASTVRTPVRFKAIALPTEHGGWSFLLEPVLLGLLVAPSTAGVLLGIAALAAFLTRHPFELALSDWRRKKRYPRTAWAERFAMGYALSAGVALIAALLATPYPFYIPLLMVVPFVLVQFYFDVQKQSRAVAAELSGAVAVAGIAMAVAMAGGWSLVGALMLWIIGIARSVPSIIYVQVRLRLDRQQPVGNGTKTVAWVLHAAGLVVLAGLAAAGLVPWLSAVAMAILCARAVWFLSPFHRPARPPIVGIQETIFGLLMVGLTAVGYWLR